MHSSLSTRPQPLFIESILAVEPIYDIFIFDLWGVIHNGKVAFDGALCVLDHLMQHKKPVYFLSNAPRRCEAAMEQLIERGVPRHLYTHLFTSGEDCFEHLRDRSDNVYQALGHKLYHLGPEKDKNLFQTLPFYTETSLDEADFILNTGTYTFDDTLEDYTAELTLGAARHLPMICANPDLLVVYGEVEALCAGRIAKEYEKMGGTVYYHGKPSTSIYQGLLQRFSISSTAKILMIGDSLRTDIKGANNAGIDSVFVLNGIHRLLDPKDAIPLYDTYDAMPVYVMTHVR